MAKVLIENYTFNAAAKTVTFTDYGTIDLDRMLLVTNATDHIIIFQFNDATKGGTVAGNVLTLTYNTASMSDTDKLQIYYDDAAFTQAKETTLGFVKTALDTVAGTVSGNEIQTDVLTLPALPAGTNNIGDVDVLSLPALPAGTNNIGDVDILTVPAPLSTTGGGTEATALRVTLANDSTGVVSVDDNGGSLTVDGTMTANAGINLNTSALNLEATQAAMKTAVDSIKTAVELIDDTVYTDGAGTVTKGIAILGQDGTNPQAIKTDAAGELQVDVLTLPALPAGTNNIGDVDVLTLPALPAGTNNIGDVDILSIAAGDNNIGNVDIVTMPNVTLAAATNTNEVVGDVAQDIPVAGNPLLIGGRASTAAPSDMSADGDSVYAWLTRKGAAVVDGGIAHDATDSGNPIKIGGKARQTNPTAVADTDRVDAVFDDIGRQVIVTGQVRDLMTDATTTISASTAETTVLAAAASTFHDATAIMIANTSATATRVDFRDTTAGSVRFSIYVPAGVTVGNNFSRPVKQATVNTNWTAQSSASVTDLRIFIQAEKNV